MRTNGAYSVLGDPPLVGMIGRKRAGKDTFAGVLSTEAAFTRVAFADPLRDVALELNPIVGTFALTPEGAFGPSVREWRLRDVVETIGWERAKDYVPEVRLTGLQGLGQAIRTLDPDFWLRIALGRIEAAPGAVVVTDVRLPNEAAAIVALGGVLVRVVRPGQVDDGDTHTTETALDDYEVDFEVLNDGTVSDLEDRARAFLATFLY